MATGRSDYPEPGEQRLGFPFIFRGALDVRAHTINEEMKVAATHALAKLAKQGGVPEAVLRGYGVTKPNSAASTSFPSRSIRAYSSKRALPWPRPR